MLALIVPILLFTYLGIVIGEKSFCESVNMQITYKTAFILPIQLIFMPVTILIHSKSKSEKLTAYVKHPYKLSISALYMSTHSNLKNIWC